MREKDLDDEIEFHRAMRERKYREQQGLSAQEAAHKAKRDFGGFEKWKEVCRDVGHVRILDELWRDLILAVRMLRKSPVFTVVALVTLTLAIGANTAIFSLMNTVMLKRLDVPQAQRLAILRTQPSEFGYAFSYPVFKETEKNIAGMAQVFAFTGRNFQMHGSNGLEYMSGELVSGQYFPALGVRPRLGRWITVEDDRPGTPRGAVAVVSDRFWRTRMSSDPQPLGKVITLNRVACTVIGVMPKGFRGMENDARPEIFVPLELEPAVDAPFNNIKAGYSDWWIHMGTKLNDGVSLEQFDSFLRARSHHFFETATPNSHVQFNRHKPRELFMVAEPGATGYSYLRLRFKKPLTVLMGLAGLVLLVACLNLASLLMARGASRGREITTRFALGASRVRLLRQLLTESLLLAVAGTGLGLALAPALGRFVTAILMPQHDPTAVPLDVSPDGMVLAFTALVAILVTVLTGTLPAMRSTKSGLHTTLRGSERRHLWPRVVLSLEVALALVLVSGAGLLGYSLLLLHWTPMGFDASGVIYLQMQAEQPPLKGDALIAKYREILTAAEGFPQVKAASISSIIPLTDNWMDDEAGVPGGPKHNLWNNRVGPDYFKTIGTPLLEGREFHWTDGKPSPPKVILNATAAQLLFPTGAAVGHNITFDNGKTLEEVVGVVADAKYGSLRETAPPTVYLPAMRQVMAGVSFNVLVRANGSPGPLIKAISKAVRQAFPNIPPPVAFSMEETVAESIATERIMAILALFFGGFALLMTGIGLYGTLAYTTERRTGEIGIRLALGALPRNVISMVCAENGAIAAAGCLAGIGGSVFASRMIANFLYGVSAKDPVVFGLAALVMLSVAAAASLVPAVKASKIDPIAAIRYE